MRLPAGVGISLRVSTCRGRPSSSAGSTSSARRFAARSPTRDGGGWTRWRAVARSGWEKLPGGRGPLTRPTRPARGASCSCWMQRPAVPPPCAPTMTWLTISVGNMTRRPLTRRGPLRTGSPRGSSLLRRHPCLPRPRRPSGWLPQLAPTPFRVRQTRVTDGCPGGESGLRRRCSWRPPGRRSCSDTRRRRAPVLIRPRVPAPCSFLPGIARTPRPTTRTFAASR